MDRYGLVWGMSEIVSREGLGLLYLSTVCSANVFVGQADLAKVTELLDLSEGGEEVNGIDEGLEAVEIVQEEETTTTLTIPDGAVSI